MVRGIVGSWRLGDLFNWRLKILSIPFVFCRCDVSFRSFFMPVGGCMRNFVCSGCFLSFGGFRFRGFFCDPIPSLSQVGWGNTLVIVCFPPDVCRSRSGRRTSQRLKWSDKINFVPPAPIRHIVDQQLLTELLCRGIGAIK